MSRLKINAYAFSKKTAQRITELLLERGINTADMLFRSEAGYLGLVPDKLRPWEFLFIPTGAVPQLAKLPVDTPDSKVFQVMMGDGVKPIVERGSDKINQHIKDSLQHWIQGDYEKALAKESKHS